jgi:hypothetical protein
MNIKVLVFQCALIMCVLCACKKDETAEKWAKEEADLAEWIKENAPDALFENDIYIVKYGNIYHDAIQPETGDHVLVNFTCRTLYDDVVEQVSYKDWKERGAQNYSQYREGGPELWPSEYWANMGIGQLQENERALVYIPSRKLDLPDFKTRKFDIELVKVIDTDLKNYQQDLMEQCMKKFGHCVDTITIEDKKRDYYVVYHITEGTGDEVSVSTVRTHYTESYYLQDNDARLCISDKEQIGWDRKFSEMFESVKKGGKITVVMPYRIMYGTDSYMDANMQYIAPPGSVLKYEISIDP